MKGLIILFVTVMLYGCAVPFMSATEDLKPDAAYEIYKVKAKESTSIIDFSLKVFDEKYLNDEARIFSTAITLRYYNHPKFNNHYYETRGDRAFRAYCEVKYSGGESRHGFCAETVDNMELVYISKTSAGADGDYTFKKYAEYQGVKDNRSAILKDNARSSIAEAKSRIISYVLDVTSAANVNVQYIISPDLKTLTRKVQNNSKSAYTFDMAYIGRFVHNHTEYGVTYKVIPNTEEAITQLSVECPRTAGNVLVINPGTTCETKITIDMPGLAVKADEQLFLKRIDGLHPIIINTHYKANKERYDNLAKKYGL